MADSDYIPTTWVDGVTPITAAQLNRMEAGVELANDRLDTVEGAGAGYTDEQAQDAVAAALAAGTHSGAAVAYNDGANSLSITATGDLPEFATSAQTAPVTASAMVGKITRYDTSAGTISQTLPAATAGRVFAIGWDAGTNALTLAAAGSDVVGSGSSTTVTVPLVGEVLTYHCTTAGRWRVVSGFKTQASLDARFAPAAARVAALPSPLVIAHRGGSNIFPENTLAALSGAASLDGVDVIEFDCALLSDGGIGLMHDATVDRTTTGSGNAVDFTTPAWRQLVADPATYLGGGWPNSPVPMLADALATAARLKVLAPEAKVGAGLTAKLVAALAAAGLKDSVIVQVPTPTDAAAVVAAGMAPMVTLTTGAEYTPSAFAAAGVRYVGAQTTSVSDATITALHAAGLKVIGYTISRQSDVAAWLARNGDGYFTDDPVYAKGLGTSYSYRTSKVPMLGTWAHGMINNAVAITTSRGKWSTSPVGVGWDDTTSAGTRSLLMGAVCPIKGNPAADTFTIEFDWSWTSAADTGRWVGGFIACPTDSAIDASGTALTGANGYRFLITPLGRMILTKIANNTGSALTDTTFSAITVPGTLALRLAVSPTGITFTDVTNGHSISTTDTAYRGGYVGLGASGVTAYCTRAEVTA
jgi:glycerophosphoryl diester phosphodiesterase